MMDQVHPARFVSERRRGRVGRSGYTVIEVMMALAVLAIGAAGIVGMQRTTILGNTRARNLTTANAVAATWAERLRDDAEGWYVQTASDGTQQHYFYTGRWLTNVGADYSTLQSGTEGVWLKPAAIDDIHPTADLFGQDVAETNTAETAFCTHLRLTHVLPRVIRAEIRVLWLRHGGPGMLNSSGGLCAVDPTVAGQHPQRYHFVYLTTSILRQN